MSMSEPLFNSDRCSLPSIPRVGFPLPSGMPLPVPTPIFDCPNIVIPLDTPINIPCPKFSASAKLTLHEGEAPRIAIVMTKLSSRGSCAYVLDLDLTLPPPSCPTFTGSATLTVAAGDPTAALTITDVGSGSACELALDLALQIPPVCPTMTGSATVTTVAGSIATGDLMVTKVGGSATCEFKLDLDLHIPVPCPTLRGSATATATTGAPAADMTITRGSGTGCNYLLELALQIPTPSCPTISVAAHTSVVPGPPAVTIMVTKTGTTSPCNYNMDFNFQIPPTEGGSATLFEGTLANVLCANNTAATINPTIGLWGTPPEETSLTVQNDFALAGPRGQVGLIVQDDDGAYHLIQVQPSNGIPVFNPGEDEIPAGAVLKPTGMVGGTITVEQPDINLLPLYLLNGPCPIPSEGTGTAWDFGDVTIDSLDASVGDAFGPTPNSWALTEGNPTTLLVQGDDGTTCRGDWIPITSIMVKCVDEISSTATGDAVVWSLAGASPAATEFHVTVFNPTSGRAGTTTLYEAIFTEGQWVLQIGAGAGGCTFTLNSPFTGTMAYATIGTAWGNIPDAAGATITVNDLNSSYARSLTGAQGAATYDSVTGYVVTICDQETLKYRGVLGGTLTPGGGPVDVGSLQPMYPFPFSQATASETLSGTDPIGLGGQNTAACYIEWNQAAGAWEITMVAPVVQQVMCREQLTTDGTNLLQYTTRDMLGWFNDTEESLYETVSGWTVTNTSVVTEVDFGDGDLTYVTQDLPIIGVIPEGTDTEFVFTTVNVTAAVVDLRYDPTVGSSPGSHQFQSKTVSFTAIDQGYPGSVDADVTDWAGWYTTVPVNNLTNTHISGAGVLTYDYTPEYVLELADPALGNAGGSLTTTTSTVVSDVQFAAGNLLYYTRTLTVLTQSAATLEPTLFGTGPITAYTALDGSTLSGGTQLTLNGVQTTFTAINPSAPGDDTAWYTPGYYPVVTSVTWDMSSETLSYGWANLYVFQETTGGSTDVLTGDPCGGG